MDTFQVRNGTTLSKILSRTKLVISAKTTTGPIKYHPKIRPGAKMQDEDGLPHPSIPMKVVHSSLKKFVGFK
jgi:hypothetical protein